MLKAWNLFRKALYLRFFECLHRAWLSAKAVEINVRRIEEAKNARARTAILTRAR